jgi:hypothetical protein
LLVDGRIWNRIRTREAQKLTILDTAGKKNFVLHFSVHPVGLVLSSSFAVSFEILELVCAQFALFYTVFRIRIGSRFNQVSGSVSGLRIRIQEDENDTKIGKKLEISCFEVLDVFFRAEGFFFSLDVLYGGLVR